jgi:opacity protein-like surface antigen
VSRLRKLLPACIAFLVAGPAVADELNNGLYLELQGGASFFDDANVSVSNDGSGKVDFDTGWNAGGAIGFRAFSWLRVEAHGSFRRADLDSVKLGSLHVSGEGWAGAGALLGNVYIDLPVPFPVKPYVGGGAGVAIFNADTNGNSVSIDDNDTKFAWNVMGGVFWPVWRHLELDLRYRYITSDDPTVDADLFGLGHGKVKAEFAAHEMVGALRVVF